MKQYYRQSDRLGVAFARFVVVSLLLASVVPASASIDQAVNAARQDRLMARATVGVEVFRLPVQPGAAVQEIFGYDATTPKIPASNLKLATTSAALDHFGSDFKFRTTLLTHDGDVILVGDGDPTFGDAEYLVPVGWRITTVYERWAAQLKKLNIATVRDVVVDDSVFDEEFFHPHWPANQAEQHYMAQVGGMSLNANLIEILVQPGAPGTVVSYTLDPKTRYVSINNRCVTGSRNEIVLGRPAGTNNITLSGQTPSRGSARLQTPVHDPALYAGQVLAETLVGSGVNVTGAIRRDRTVRQQRLSAGSAADTQWPIIAVHDTAIAAVLGRANKDSVNLYAESLCKRLGADTAKASGSWANGTAAVGAFLQKIGIPAAEFSLDDGCGLSKENRISPHALASVLAYDFSSRNKGTFVDSLSIAGVDGTLEHRFESADTRDLRKRVLGKSGFVEGVSTLSGLLHAADGNWYAFSIMMNGIPRGSNGSIKPLQERIVRAIDDSAAAAPAAGH